MSAEDRLPSDLPAVSYVRVTSTTTDKGRVGQGARRGVGTLEISRHPTSAMEPHEHWQRTADR